MSAWLLILLMTHVGAPRAPFVSPSHQNLHRGRSVACRLRPADLARRLRSQVSRLLPARIAYWSQAFLGTPYWTPPPGGKPDLGPNRCAVDCETFVEQVIALSRSDSVAAFRKQLRAIRFVNGVPLPAMRHFTVAQGWLAQAQRMGFLQDITGEVGKRSVREVTRDLTPAGWSPRYLMRYFALGVHAPTGVARLSYIPMAAAQRRVRQIPSGTILHVVAAPHPCSPYLVTHVGIVLQTRFGPIFRHASQSPHRRRVEDRPLGPYLYYIQHTPAGPEMRTAIGVHLSKVLPRASALARPRSAPPRSDPSRPTR